MRDDANQRELTTQVTQLNFNVKFIGALTDVAQLGVILQSKGSLAGFPVRVTD